MTGYPVGIAASELDTPALMVDAGALLRNIRRMAAFFAGRPAKLRPHFKTHKAPLIAHLQVSHGAIGITCAKLSEAGVLIHAGLTDILIANQVATPFKLAQLAGLAHLADLKVCVDQAGNVKDLAAAARAAGSTIGVLVEVDVGMGRCGTRSTAATVELAALAASSPGLRFRGLVGYEGHAVFTPSREERALLCRRANALLLEHAEAVRAAGLPCAIVSAGGTGTYDLAGTHPGITEVQAGSYVFMDATYAGVVDFEQALTVMATVISRPEPSKAIIDVGMKAISRDFGLPQPTLPGAETRSLSEEHGELRLEEAARQLRVGDRVELVPTHCCTTVNLHDQLFVTRDGLLQDIWPITARGGFR